MQQELAITFMAPGAPERPRGDTTNQVRTIRLYGKLGARFGRIHRMAVKSAAEAVRALASQLPGLEAYLMQSKDRGERYAVFYGKKNLAEEQLRDSAGQGDIRIAPILMGAKNGGVFQVIVGAILIIVGAAINIISEGALSWIGTPIIGMGISMMIGGIVQLLTPFPKGRSSKDSPGNTPGYAFNGPINTQAQGNPVPVLYGELIVGSAVVSAGITAVDQAYVPSGGGLGPGRGGGGTPGWQAEWAT